ncbi:MAG: hypothetical protein HY423_01730 [Candidatus Lambdaproteobacteria bacterium]|nr:hypothetical protein [Candidatus Lambdaproteobacteria bacterium]
MGRWLAIGRVPGWDDLAKFSAELKATSKWRVSPRTTVTTVLALEDGRVLAECHGPDRKEFDAWLEQLGWQVESVTPISHLAKTGDIWAVE